MIRVLLDVLPDVVPRESLGQNTVLVDGVEMPALYFNNNDIDIASSFGGVMLITE